MNCNTQEIPYRGGGLETTNLLDADWTELCQIIHGLNFSQGHDVST